MNCKAGEWLVFHIVYALFSEISFLTDLEITYAPVCISNFRDAPKHVYPKSISFSNNGSTRYLTSLSTSTSSGIVVTTNCGVFFSESGVANTNNALGSFNYLVK